MSSRSPMLYREAAKFLDGKGAGSLRSRVYNRLKDKNRAKAVFALVTETLKYRHVLEPVLEKAQFFSAEKRVPKTVALVMAYDLLLSKSGRLVCGKCTEKEAVLRHKTRLKAELARYTVKNGPPVPRGGDETPVRWVRCNCGVYTIDQMEKFLESDLKLERVDHLALLTSKTYFKDNNVVGLYGVHPRVSVANWKPYQDGQIIIQDRASCFPVTMLSEALDIVDGIGEQTQNNIFIDACAAPGNKTTQLAAWTGAHVIAFERDPKRAQTLQKMVDKAHLTDQIQVDISDFTASEPREVGGLVVDPSCSGSGVFGRGTGESEREEAASQDRLERLAEFQYIVMRHALSYDAPVAVYSTCSIHATENEQVVRRLLETPEIAEKWRLCDRVLPNWTRRGWPSEFEGMDEPEKLAAACVRVEPRVDFGIGFFAACFERIST